MTGKPLFDIPFLASRWRVEYEAFAASPEASDLLSRLRNWATGGRLNESSSEGAFIRHFFVDTWGYLQEGDTPDGTFQCWPQFPVSMAGQRGGTGQADLALGFFSKTSGEPPPIPQVLCEFKDIRSALDKRQFRKGNDRTPVQQCFDYLRESRTRLSGYEPVEPFWAIVTDMNEFRLYCMKGGMSQYQRFVIDHRSDDDPESLLDDTTSAKFQRFLFWKLFHYSSLLSERGLSPLQLILDDQLIHEAALEKDFYLEYKAYREMLFRTLREMNPDFKGTPGKLVRLTQRFLDRCLFILFCEDMGQPLFPGDLLRQVLIRYSCDPYYNPDDAVPWERLKTIFAVMRDGGAFGKQQINRFNGGLFEPLPELENLRIPASIFCAEGQGAGGPTTLLAHPMTLLYFSAKYNFGIKSACEERVIDFYALGRIFEQSITELEIMEAEADGRPSLNLLSKRKRNGVYYTPEWVTEYIVRETVGTRLADIKSELGLTPDRAPSEEDVVKYRQFLRDRRYTAPVAGERVGALNDYMLYLKRIRIVDPACGSGAFLIQALEYLKGEYRWVYNELERIRGTKELWESEVVTRSILNENLYGVDINPESVEITKLALWMHTALPGKALSQLDHNIQCGNSLVGPDFATFYENKHVSLFTELDEAKRERINTFDWQVAFPEVFARGGFDCVIGNPPYVKLQNFRRVEEDVAEYLTQATANDGYLKYASTQIGNFDLYLPFIEMGVSLLRPGGRMGYIAPNVWMVNDYGAPLRRWLKANRRLDRWIDFKSFQVFSEATTYTALQFFHDEPTNTVRCIFAPDGIIDNIDWNEPDAIIPYNDLPENGAWNLVGAVERKLLLKLSGYRKLEMVAKDGAVGFRGIESGADEFFHFRKAAPSAYIGIKNGSRKDMRGMHVTLDDCAMRPLVSTKEALGYILPKTSIYAVFPYTVQGNEVQLMSAQSLQTSYPRLWAWFKENEADLRARDNGAMDNDNTWWAYTRPMNLVLQGRPKLGVAQTVKNLRVFFDSKGEFCFNNVRVGGILAPDEITGWFLLGVLNSPIPDWFFRRISRPKEGGYYEANKQFLTQLPIPEATEAEMKDVGDRAMMLQEFHSNRRDLVDDLDRYLASPQMLINQREPNWIWADVRNLEHWKELPGAPEDLKGRALTSWARERMSERLKTHLDEIDKRLRVESVLTVKEESDELRLMIDGVVVIDVFGQNDAAFLAAQWRQKIRATSVTEKFSASSLLRILLDLSSSDDLGLQDSIIKLDKGIQKFDELIGNAESVLNSLIYQLYSLTPDEIDLCAGKDSVQSPTHL